MTEKELKRLERDHPLHYAVMMYKLNPINSWKERIRELYSETPDDDKRFFDVDSGDYEIRRILGFI